MIKSEIMVDGFSNINETGGVTRVNYTIVGDLNSKTKYMLYYVPHSRDTLSLIYTLKTFSKSIISIINNTLSLKTKNQLDNYSVCLEISVSLVLYIYTTRTIYWTMIRRTKLLHPIEKPAKHCSCALWILNLRRGTK